MKLNNFKIKQYKDKNGLATNYFDNCLKNKPTIVFIHGGRSQPTANYPGLLRELSKKYRVIAPEIPGFVNHCYPSKMLDLKELAVFFNNLLKKEKIKKYSVSGHSIGGGVALLMAYNNPEIKKVIASNSAGYPLNFREERLALSMIYKTVKQSSSKQFLKVFKKIYKDVKSISNGHNGGKNSSSFALKAATYAMNKNYSVFFKKIKAPVLIIHARRDNLFKKHCAQYLVDLMPKSTLLEVKGFHDWPMHEGVKFAKAIEEFLEKNNKT